MPRPLVLVTGSSGLIGSAIVEKLRDDYTVVGFDVQAPVTSQPTDFVEIDLSDQDAVEEALATVRARHGDHVASVVHLAAYYDFSGEPSPLYASITVEGTRRLLRALGDFRLDQFIFSSSMLVHAATEPGGRIDEDDPLEAKWAYPQSKVEAEQVLREERGEVPVVFLRIGGVYTTFGQQPTLVQQIKRIREKDLTSFLFPGDVRAGQAFVHLDDAADAIVRTVERRRELRGETPILIGEPNPPSYGELQDRLGELLHGRAWPTIRIPKPVAKVGAAVQDALPGMDPFIKPFMIDLADDHYALDVQRAQELLGWQPRHHILKALPRIIEQLRQDPEAWYRHNKLAS